MDPLRSPTPWLRFLRPGLAVNTVLDLQGLRIAVLRDSVQESTLRAMLSGFGIQAELVPVASFAQAFQAVADGRVDLAAVNHFFGGYQSGRLGWSSDIASHMGGDEFVVILTEADAAGATHFAQRLIEAMRAPVHVAHSEISVGLSIGVALFPDDGTEADVLLRKADAAMYQAKAAGRNDLRFFTPELQARSDRLLALSTALARAVELEQMAVHYQPLVSLRTGRVVAAEALLRWRHPELGDDSPAEFVPVAENTGRILELGRWVPSTAARQARHWRIPGDRLTVAVNISAVQFRHRDFVDTVRDVLQREGLPAQRLELELTESIPMGEPAAAAAIQARLAELSVRVSIDDFGTGHSSLGYLKKLGFYKLKIDRSFVTDIGRDPDDEAIIRAIVQLAQAGCDHLQGWLVSPAMPADAFEAFVAAHDPRAFLERLGAPPLGDAMPR